MGNPRGPFMLSSSEREKYPSSTSSPETRPKKISSPSNSLAYHVQLLSGVKNLTRASASSPSFSLAYKGGNLSRMSLGRSSCPLGDGVSASRTCAEYQNK